jgi:hypothetical protein
MRVILWRRAALPADDWARSNQPPQDHRSIPETCAVQGGGAVAILGIVLRVRRWHRVAEFLFPDVGIRMSMRGSRCGFLNLKIPGGLAAE